ncbi:L,D-transpeptidase [Aquabacterium sp.]|uniref:L,D-transpeptidase n=1 Tax=Aquabacterium sp. TaxID=1872578 RepID=UPI002B7AB3AB|nr:L,D-transpeptidase [Aquabacterium sp.]HSW06808.1 L,D-transpeptidase [Aquabacterium sp.]
MLAAAELVRLHVPGPWRSVAAIHTAQPAAQPTPAVPPAPGQALIDEDPIARIIAAHQAKLDLTAHRASGDVRNIVPRIIRLADNAGLPFLVVDKRSARLFIFDAQGRLLDDGPVLLGLARGDNTVPGIAERPLDQVRPFERTTPAGRFVARHGRNTAGEDVVWVDYGAAVSMHRVRATVAAERRLQRLASRTSADNRISFGCINLPPALYEQGVQPLLLRSPAVVYVLPETRPITKQFRSLFDDAPADHPGLRA